MSYAIQASPLTKMFLPEWQHRCLQDPKLLTQAVPFTVHIPRASGAVVMTHGKPIHMSQLIPNTGLRKIERDEARDLMMWLTDEQSGETDMWGVVALDIDKTVQNSINNMLSLDDLMNESEDAREKALRRQMEMQKRLIDTMRSAVQEAQQRANERVMKQLKITHRNLISQWDNNRAVGGNPYPPSACEAIGAWILKEEIQKANSAKQEMIQNMRNLMDATKVG